MGFFVDDRPGPPFGFLVGNTAGFVAFLHVFGLSLLLIGAAEFVSAGHYVLL